LSGFISHKGTSAHCGHYVAHLLKGEKWVLFNDEKVVEVPDITKAIGEAYIYIYERKP
jgi:ubiquitin carboxyl-terminal hydrolase 5/13